jgi:hypothetical protein
MTPKEILKNWLENDKRFKEYAQHMDDGFTLSISDANLHNLISFAINQTFNNTEVGALSITDLITIIDLIEKANADAMREKIRSHTFTESQKPLKIHYPYPEKILAALKKELKNRLNIIKTSLQ